MTDDIVTRLREQNHKWENSEGGAILMQNLEQAVDALIADRDNWRRIAEKAIEELKKAVQLLETVNKAPHD